MQRNVVERCSYLFPAVLHASTFWRDAPLALIEIGCSVGLNLLLDQYAYIDSSTGPYGNRHSDIVIPSDSRGSNPFNLEMRMPPVHARIGLDPIIVDHTCPDQIAWLEALIWPEHPGRRSLFRQALHRRSFEPLDLQTCDGFAEIETALNAIPAACLPVIYHTHVANQVTPEKLTEFSRRLSRIATHRDLAYLHRNRQPDLHLDVFQDGERKSFSLAQTCIYGRWWHWQPTRESRQALPA